MPVNNFEFEKADGIISSIKGQSVGRDPISAAAIFNFVSIAQKGFGYEPEDIDMFIINDVNGTLDKTWQEIYDAMIAGKVAVIVWSGETPEEGKYTATHDYVVYITFDPGDTPKGYIKITDSGHRYECNARDEYPTYAD